MGKITDPSSPVTVPATGEQTTLGILARQRRIAFTCVADVWVPGDKAKMRYFVSVDGAPAPTWRIPRDLHRQLHIISTTPEPAVAPVIALVISSADAPPNAAATALAA